MTDDTSLESPDYRATICDGRLTVIRWYPQLMAPWGPATAHFRSRERAGVTVADLTAIREPECPLELVVRFLSGASRQDAREAIVDWARTVGYARVWFPDDVVDLDGAAPLPACAASTRCTSCATRWQDGAPEFWLHVRALGNFPIACPLCGSDMPQWQLDPSGGESESEQVGSTTELEGGPHAHQAAGHEPTADR